MLRIAEQMNEIWDGIKSLPWSAAERYCVYQTKNIHEAWLHALVVPLLKDKNRPIKHPWNPKKSGKRQGGRRTKDDDSDIDRTQHTQLVCLFE
jgi:hypothetical protein